MQLEIQKPDEKIEYECKEIGDIRIGSYFFIVSENKHFLMITPRISEFDLSRVLDLLTNRTQEIDQNLKVACHHIWGPSEIKLVVQEKLPEREDD